MEPFNHTPDDWPAIAAAMAGESVTCATFHPTHSANGGPVVMISVQTRESLDRMAAKFGAKVEELDVRPDEGSYAWFHAPTLHVNGPLTDEPCRYCHDEGGPGLGRCDACGLPGRG